MKRFGVVLFLVLGLVDCRGVFAVCNCPCSFLLFDHKRPAIPFVDSFYPVVVGKDHISSNRLRGNPIPVWRVWRTYGDNESEFVPFYDRSSRECATNQLDLLALLISCKRQVRTDFRSWSASLIAAFYYESVYSSWKLRLTGEDSGVRCDKSFSSYVVHFDRVQSVKSNEQNASKLNIWLYALPCGFLCLICNLAMGWGFLSIRLNRCSSDRQFLLCCIALFGGFVGAVISGIVFTNRIGI